MSSYDSKRVIELVAYQQRRIYVAYKSHREKKIAEFGNTDLIPYQIHRPKSLPKPPGKLDHFIHDHKNRISI